MDREEGNAHGDGNEKPQEQKPQKFPLLKIYERAKTMSEDPQITDGVQKHTLRLVMCLAGRIMDRDKRINELIKHVQQLETAMEAIAGLLQGPQVQQGQEAAPVTGAEPAVEPPPAPPAEPEPEPVRRIVIPVPPPNGSTPKESA